VGVERGSGIRTDGEPKAFPKTGKLFRIEKAK
jgi:hypothetical protein